MIYREIELFGRCQSELDTEIKYSLASAKYDGVELICFSAFLADEEKENKRISTCIVKVLRNIKKEGGIQFFIKKEALLETSAESGYLLNKYAEHLTSLPKDKLSVLAKI